MFLYDWVMQSGWQTGDLLQIKKQGSGTSQFRFP